MVNKKVIVTFYNTCFYHSDKTCIAWMHCKSLWIKASAKCINVNVNNTIKNFFYLIWLLWKLKKKKDNCEFLSQFSNFL